MIFKFCDTDMMFNGSFSMLFGGSGEQADAALFRLPFVITTADCGFSGGAGMVSARSCLTDLFKYIKHSYNEAGRTLSVTYGEKTTGLEVSCNYECTGRTVRQTTSVTNRSSKSVEITKLTGAYVSGIGSGRENSLLRGRKSTGNDYMIYSFRNTWEGEYQTEQTSFKDAGLNFYSDHQMTGAFRRCSLGSFTTANYMPSMFVEDRKEGKIWFASMEAEGNWQLEVSCNAYEKGVPGSYYIAAYTLDDRYCQATVVLAPGETFSASPMVFGNRQGGIEEAVAALTSFRRAKYKRRDNPVVFNDYMNCLWTAITPKCHIPLVNSAAAAGAECFCIDAGWFSERHWDGWLGDWKPKDELFGEGGLKGLIDYIGSKGMTASIWLETECCGENTEAFKHAPKRWFIQRNGKLVGDKSRRFFNFAEPDMFAYMKSCYQYLYDLGIRFIKNDYNACLGACCDPGRSGLIAYHRAAMAFYEDIRATFPDLVLENCGSGAMRCDYGTLKHFDMQSTSDQEQYQLYPSIIQGALMHMLPEQAGIWAYPYPLPFYDRENKTYLTDKKYLKSMADGEQTAFNMVSGLAGCLYLSGNIDRADDLNAALISEGIAFAKAQRGFISKSSAVFPYGLTALHDDDFVVVGLKSDSEMLLYVWRTEGNKKSATFSLGKYFPQGFTVKQSYPERLSGAIAAQVGDGKVQISFEKKCSARIFSVKGV